MRFFCATDNSGDSEFNAVESHASHHLGFMILGAVAEPEELPFAVAIVAVALALTHIPDAWLTFYIAKKGLHTKKIEQAMQPHAVDS